MRCEVFDWQKIEGRNEKVRNENPYRTKRGCYLDDLLAMV
jgi:hypothetical protein